MTSVQLTANAALIQIQHVAITAADSVVPKPKRSPSPLVRHIVSLLKCALCFAAPFLVMRISAPPNLPPFYP